jgi:hypothetical protein
MISISKRSIRGSATSGVDLGLKLAVRRLSTQRLLRIILARIITSLVASIGQSFASHALERLSTGVGGRLGRTGNITPDRLADASTEHQFLRFLGTNKRIGIFHNNFLSIGVN